MKRILMAAILVAAALWIGWAARGAAGKPSEALMKADEAFAKATAEKGLEGWLSWFAPEARIFPAGENVIEGLVAIKAHYAKTGFDPKPLAWKPVYADIAASGDLGYTYGYATWPDKDEKGNKVMRGSKYLTIWKKQADGSWKVAADLGNSAPVTKP